MTMGVLSRLFRGQDEVKPVGSERDTAWWDGDHSRRWSAVGFPAMADGGDVDGGGVFQRRSAELFFSEKNHSALRDGKLQSS